MLRLSAVAVVVLLMTGENDVPGINTASVDDGMIPQFQLPAVAQSLLVVPFQVIMVGVMITVVSMFVIHRPALLSEISVTAVGVEEAGIVME